jgi:hypothetical protein
MKSTELTAMIPVWKRVALPQLRQLEAFLRSLSSDPDAPAKYLPEPHS